MASKVTGIYRKTLRDDNFGCGAAATDVALVQNVWTQVGTYTIPAQQEIAVGVTEAYSGGGQGRPAYIRFDHTDGTQITGGNVRVIVTDANDANAKVIADHSFAEWSASATNRTTALLIPESMVRAVEDSKIKIEAYSTTASLTVDMSDADTDISMPVTVYTIGRA